MSEVKHTFLKSFRGKKLEGEHGVWFGGEWEEREWFVWLISLIWQDKGIREAVLGKIWANPWEALPSGAWSTGEPRSTACDKGVGEPCRLKIWADCPRTAPQKLPHMEHRWASVDCMWQGDEQALPTENLSWLPKDRSTKTPSCGAQASLSRLCVTRGWASAASWEFEFFFLSFFFLILNFKF